MPDFTESKTEGAKVADKVKHGDFTGAIQEAQEYLKELQKRDPEHYKQQAQAFTDELVRDGGLPLLEFELGTADHLHTENFDKAALTAFEQTTQDPLAAALADLLLSKWDTLPLTGDTTLKSAVDQYCENRDRIELHDGASVMYDSSTPPKVMAIYYADGTNVEFIRDAEGKLTLQTDNAALNGILTNTDGQTLAVDTYGNITLRSETGSLVFQTDASLVRLDAHGIVMPSDGHQTEDLLARHYADEIELAFQKSGTERDETLRAINNEMLTYIQSQPDQISAQSSIFGKVTAQLALDGQLGNGLYETFAHNDALQNSINGSKYQGWYHGDTLNAYAASSAAQDTNDPLSAIHRMFAAGFATNFNAIDIAANGGNTDNMAGDGDLQTWKDKSAGRAAAEVLLISVENLRGIPLFDNLYNGREITKEQIQDCLSKDRALLTTREIDALNFLLTNFDEIAGKNGNQLTEFALKVYATDRNSSAETAYAYSDATSAQQLRGWNDLAPAVTPDQQHQQVTALRTWMGIDTIGSLGSVDSEKILGALNGMTAAERTSLEKAYEATFHSSLRHDLQWRLGDKYPQAESILDRADGKADVASHIHNALNVLESEFAPWRDGGFAINDFPQTDAQKGALKDIRDTLSVLNSMQLAELRADYLSKYGISLDEALLHADDIEPATSQTIALYLQAGGTDKRTNDTEFVESLAVIALQSKDLRMFEEAFRGSSDAARAAFKTKYGESTVKNAFGDCYEQMIALDYLNFGRAQLATVAAQDTHWLHTNKDAILVACKNATPEEREQFTHGRELAQNADISKLQGKDLEDYNYYKQLHAALKNAAYDWEVNGWEAAILYPDSTFIRDFTATHHDGALGSAIGSWTDSYMIQDVFRNMSESDWELLTYKGVEGLNAEDKAKYDSGKVLLAKAAEGVALTADEQKLADFTKSVDDKVELSKSFNIDVRSALAAIWMNDDDRNRVNEILNFKVAAASFEDSNSCPNILDLFELYKDKGVFGAYYRDHNKLIDGVLNMSAEEQKEYWLGKQIQSSGKTELTNEEQLALNFATSLDNNVNSYLDNGAMKDAAQRYLSDLAATTTGEREPSLLVNFLHDAAVGKSALTLANDIANDPSGTIKEWARLNPEAANNLIEQALYKCDIPSGITYGSDGSMIYPTVDPLEALRDSILSGTTKLQDRLLLTDDKAEMLDAIKNSTPAERTQLLNDASALNNLSASDAEFLKQIARDVTLDENGKPQLPAADTMRAFVLGYASEAQVRAIISGETAQEIIQLKTDYRTKYNGADLESDILNKVDAHDQSQYIAWLQSTEIVAIQDYMDKTHALNSSYSFMDSFMRSSWDGTQNYAFQAADNYAAAIADYSSKFEALPADVQRELSAKLEEATKAFKESRGQMNEQLVDLAIMLGTMAVTMGGSALLQATAMSTRMAVFAASGAIFKVLAKRAMDGTEAELDLASVMRDAVTGGLSGGLAAITPEDLLGALPEAFIAKLTGGVVGRDIVASLGQRVTGLIGEEGQALLQEKIDHLILRAIATGEKINSTAALKTIQEVIDQSPELAKLVADNPGLRDTIANTIANNLANQIEIGSSSAILDFGQKQLRGLLGGETIMEISTTVSTTAAGVMAWDQNKSIGENMSIIIAQVLEADKQALGTGLVFHFGMQGFSLAVQVGTLGARYVGLVKPGELPTAANLIVTYEDGTQQLIKPGQEIPNINQIKDVASVPEVLAPRNANTGDTSTVIDTAAVDTVTAHVDNPTLKANVELGMAEMSAPAQRLLADGEVVVQPVSNINDLDAALLDQVAPGKGGKTFRQILEDPNEGGAFYDPTTDKIYVRPDAKPDAIAEELWHAVNKGLKDFAGSAAMERANILDHNRNVADGTETDAYFDLSKNEQANQEIFQRSARILDKLDRGQTLTAEEVAFSAAHKNALEVTAERLYMEGMLKKAPWELFTDSPASKNNPHPGIEGNFKSGKDYIVPPDAIGHPEQLLPVAAQRDYAQTMEALKAIQNLPPAEQTQAYRTFFAEAQDQHVLINNLPAEVLPHFLDYLTQLPAGAERNFWLNKLTLPMDFITSASEAEIAATVKSFAGLIDSVQGSPAELDQLRGFWKMLRFSSKGIAVSDQMPISELRIMMKAFAQEGLPDLSNASDDFVRAVSKAVIYAQSEGGSSSVDSTSMTAMTGVTPQLAETIKAYLENGSLTEAASSAFLDAVNNGNHVDSKSLYLLKSIVETSTEAQQLEFAQAISAVTLGEGNQAELPAAYDLIRILSDTSPELVYQAVEKPLIDSIKDNSIPKATQHELAYRLIEIAQATKNLELLSQVDINTCWEALTTALLDSTPELFANRADDAFKLAYFLSSSDPVGYREKFFQPILDATASDGFPPDIAAEIGNRLANEQKMKRLENVEISLGGYRHDIVNLGSETAQTRQEAEAALLDGSIRSLLGRDGKLGKLFPDILGDAADGGIVGRTQNGLHDFTVDEHTLVIIDKLRTNPDFQTLPPDQQIDTLWAALLHDSGKLAGKSDPAQAMKSEGLTWGLLKSLGYSDQRCLRIMDLVYFHDKVGYADDMQNLTLPQLQNPDDASYANKMTVVGRNPYFTLETSLLNLFDSDSVKANPSETIATPEVIETLQTINNFLRQRVAALNAKSAVPIITNEVPYGAKFIPDYQYESLLVTLPTDGIDAAMDSIDTNQTRNRTISATQVTPEYSELFTQDGGSSEIPAVVLIVSAPPEHMVANRSDMYTGFGRNLQDFVELAMNYGSTPDTNNGFLEKVDAALATLQTPDGRPMTRAELYFEVAKYDTLDALKAAIAQNQESPVYYDALLKVNEIMTSAEPLGDGSAWNEVKVNNSVVSGIGIYTRGRPVYLEGASEADLQNLGIEGDAKPSYVYTENPPVDAIVISTHTWEKAIERGLPLIILDPATVADYVPPTADYNPTTDLLPVPPNVADAIDNVGVINENIMRGSWPIADENGMQALKDAGVKTIIDLDDSPSLIAEESAAASRLGMNFEAIPLSEVERPSNEQIAQILRLMEDPQNQPVYIHCKQGADRTGAIIAIYRMTHDGWSIDKAYEEMRHFGFNTSYGELLQAVKDWSQA
ncbi:MAG: dual specificity protein phosphatase family protein [Cyanobacteria bacterium SZAS-4]|nr:dual specificity protein phosphatase family protein [Cyanobacteria bacterium SZAS-4]